MAPTECRTAGASEVKRSVKQIVWYIVTIKMHTHEPVSYERLIRELNIVKNRLGKETIWGDEIGFELDSLGRSHVHTYCCIHGRQPYFKNLQKKGMNIDFSPFPRVDVKKVIDYCLKNTPNYHAVLQTQVENQFLKGAYAFSDSDQIPTIKELLLS